ncbi:MAG: ATP synthase subunit C [Oscillospiraceae bacterium]
MKTILMLLLPLVAIILLATPLYPVYKGITSGVKAKRSIIFNLCAFAGVCVLAFAFPIAGIVSAAGEVASTASSASVGMGYLAAALVTGLSCLGAGIAVAAAAPAAIGAVSEDAKSFGKAMIFVVLGEGVAIYGLLISILILNRI